MKIVVLCGGISTEREVSLRTSTKVSTALAGRGHQVVMIDVFFGEEKRPSFDLPVDYAAKADEYRSKNDLITPDLISRTGLFGPNVVEICREADIVFIGLHGANGEDGKVQAFSKKRALNSPDLTPFPAHLP